MLTVFCRSEKDVFHFPVHVEYGTNYTDKVQPPPQKESYTVLLELII